MTNFYRKGVGAVEFIVVVALLVVLSTVVLVAFSKIGGNKALSSSTVTVATILNQARSKTLSAEGDSQYGVHIESTGVTLFKGGVYSSSDPNNEVTSVNSRVSISGIALTGGVSDVVFERLTGDSSVSGTLTLSLLSTPTTQRTVTISLTGVIQVN